MKTSHRNYTESAGDFNLISQWIITHHTHVRSQSTWCLGRFVDWRVGLWGAKPTIPDFWGKNGQLWFDGFGELAGFAISEDGGPEFVIITTPGYGFLYEEILAWVLKNWSSRGPHLSVEITENQKLEAKILEQHGFHHSGTFFTRKFDLQQMSTERFPLEEGFKIIDLDSHPDYREQRLLRANAFRNKDTYTEEELLYELELDAYARQHSPIYHAPADIYIMAPDGKFVSGCEGLIDARNRSADIERICTHSDYRRRGFARVAIQECMVRLLDMGIQYAYIAGYSRAAISLYGSLGHVEESRGLIYKQSENQI